MKKTLLEKAKEIKKNRASPFDQENIDMAVAWFNGDITTTQVANVLCVPPTGYQVHGRCAGIIKKAIATGKLKIN